MGTKQPQAGGVTHLGRAKNASRSFGLQKNYTYTYHLRNPSLEHRKAMSRKVKAVAPIDAPDRRRLPHLLRRAWYGLNQAFRRRIAHLGLTPDQFTALRTVLEHEGISQRQLTSLMSSDPNTVASLLERMENAGWIERQTREQDRRTNRLRLKACGRSKYEKAREIAVALQQEVLAALPRGAQEEFLTNLDAIADACRIAAINSTQNRTSGDARPV